MYLLDSRQSIVEIKALMLRKRILFSFLLLALALTACDSADSAGGVASGDDYAVDALYREFYDQLGGEETLGEPISPLFTYGRISYQYTVAALMAHDPDAPEAERFYLAALGLDTGLLQPAVPNPNDPALRYLNGHIIHPEFEPLYQAIGGRRIAGNPLSEARYNPERGRIEQHFENVGIFRRLDDPPGEARLLAYGLWKCDASCRRPTGIRSDMRLGVVIAVDPAFASSVERLGAHFTGLPVSEAYTNAHGNLEQVFENLVLARGSGKKGRIFARPLLEMLAIASAPPGAPGGVAGMTFIAVHDGLGFDVPQRFLDYLAQHGGLDISGLPIAPLEQTDENTLRQCFTNLCLEEHLDEAGPLRIRPEARGFAYWLQSGAQGGQPETPPAPQPTSEPERQPAPETAPQAEPEPAGYGVIVMQVWEQRPILAPDQQQEIGVIVLENNRPVRNLEPELVVILPGGEERRYYMFPTGQNGQSALRIDPIQAAAGEAIAYRVCVFYPLGETNCVEDTFLIWQP